MNKKRILSLLLCLATLCALLVPASSAADGDTGDKTKGIELSKTAKYNEDGTYTITLEAYATGEKTTTEVKKDVPTDIILVLDQSGSMDDPMGTVSFTAYTGNNARNSKLYSHRHNGGDNNLWHQLSDGSHVSVSVISAEKPNYTKITSGRNNDNNYGKVTNYWNNRNKLYALVNGEYQKVDVTREWQGGAYLYIYTLSGGTQIAQSRGYKATPQFTGIDGNALYLLDSVNVYTYTYMDSDGNEQIIGTSEGDNTTFSTTLYSRGTNPNGGGKRIDAIKTAATTFVNAVATKAAGADGDITTTTDNINHRIAVVGFASQSGWGYNTELLSIKGSNSGSVGVAYDNIQNSDLKDVVQDMNTTAGQTMVRSAINALDAEGATEIDLGMDMAERILNANPVPANEQRNRVVIVFTDGSPTTDWGFNKTVANNAIDISNRIKNSGTTVYSIGVFSGADADSAGTEPNGNLNDGNGQIPAASNWFMQKVSSNNGTPQKPSYYLSAADAASLNNIFQQISDQIETGGSSTTLDGTAEIRDIVSPYFTMPANTTGVKVYCANSQGSTNSWSDRQELTNAKVTLNQTNSTVSVTGFDFKSNWCGNETTNGTTTFHNGQKLIIEFEVQPKSDFLGGNDVETNGANSGIYDKDGTAVKKFDVPTVNVPIPKIEITAVDKNVYLCGTVTAEELKTGATVKIGSVTLNLSDPDYGLAAWQTKYAKVNVEVLDAEDKVVTNLDNLKADTTYKVKVTVTPETEGTESPEKGPAVSEEFEMAEADINVFKPEVTFTDTEVYYGETRDTFGPGSKSEKWMQGDTDANEVTMTGSKPILTFSYGVDSGLISTTADGKYEITSKNDIPAHVSSVTATVEGKPVGITTDDIVFKHTACEGDETLPTDEHFWIHVKTCQLTITKTGGTTGESYVFNVYKEGSNDVYTQVSVYGNGSETIYELPVGTYSITEDEGWSWRFKNRTYSDGVTLSSSNTSGTITCTNSNPTDKWLNGFSTIVKNIFGAKN